MDKTAETKLLANIADFIKKYTGSPLVLAGGLGLGTYGLGRLAWGPMVETFRSLGRPIGKKMLGGDGQGGQADAAANAQWNEAMDNLKEDAERKRILPVVGGVLTSAAALAMLFNKGKEGYGLLKWNAPRMPVANTKRTGKFPTSEWTTPPVHATGTSPRRLAINARNLPYMGHEKLAAWEMNPNQSYVSDINWDNHVQLGTARSLFADDPFLATRPGARLSGIAIVNDAAIREKTRTPTLGGIFDSAVDKIGKKLSLGGVIDVGIKTAVANGASRLLTGAIGAMCGLSPSTREKLIDAGTWAGAVTAILN